MTKLVEDGPGGDPESKMVKCWIPGELNSFLAPCMSGNEKNRASVRINVKQCFYRMTRFQNRIRVRMILTFPTERAQVLPIAYLVVVYHTFLYQSCKMKRKRNLYVNFLGQKQFLNIEENVKKKIIIF